MLFLYINNNTIYIEHRKRTTEKIFFLLFVNSYVHALSRSETRVLIFFFIRGEFKKIFE